MSQPPADDRAVSVRGIVWASQISSLGLELALPILGGYWLDERWRTKPWLLLLGALLGITIFTLSVIRLSQKIARKESSAVRD